MLSVRRVLTVLGLAFTAYMAARGLSWTDPAAILHPALLIAAMVLCLATTWLCIFLAPRSAPPDVASQAAGSDARPLTRARLPLWAGVLALVAALVTPTAVALAVTPESRTLLFANWYIGGLGALMTIVVVGRRPVIAWTGTLLLALGSAAWMGPLSALGVGLVGSLMWVTVAQVSVLSLDRAAQDTVHLADLQRAASAWQASQAGRQRERRVRVQGALEVAGPVLARVVLSGGDLAPADRVEARLAEGRLRDELRGPRLLDDDVRAALEAARRAGTTVTVLDEGGLDGLDPAALAVIRAELAETVRGSNSSRLYIRTSPHDRIAVTVVGRQEADGALSDDDSVDLWREIPYPGAD